MHIKIITLATLMAMSLQLNAQTTIATNFKPTGQANPISGCVFCADPTALDYNGRLYVYGSNDHQQFIKNGKKGENGYGDIKSFVIFSTDDMVNWTFHGTIDVAKVCSSWGGGFFRSWAPSVTWRHNEETGKDEFFLYFANWASNVGVLTADSPIGPWKSPLTKALVTGDTPGVNPCNWCFDPGVVIDENGTGWLSFGGGDPNAKGTSIQPNNAGIIKLKPSMTAIDGKAAKIPAPYHFEASELNVMNGKFVYTYCSSWAERKDADWNAYKTEKGINVSKPDLCTMCYMVSDNPMDPDSWEYKGVYGPHSTAPNNHSHLHKFLGNYYHIYHSGGLLESMKNAKAVDSDASTYRSICVDEVSVDEATQTISKVNLTTKGVAPLKALNPYVLQQAETMASCGGVNYEDFKNVTTTSKSNLGNDASENMYIKMAAGSWTSVRNVDFGETGAKSFILRAKGTGTFEIRTASKGEPIATMDFSSEDFENHVIDIDPEAFKGVKNFLFLVFTQADNVQFDAWGFSTEAANGIAPIRTNNGQPKALFDLNGHRLTNGTPYRGIVIEQYQDENGNKWSRKRLSTNPVH